MRALDSRGPSDERGAALAVALVLLVILTLLALAVVHRERIARQGAAGDAAAREAFEAAELASASALAAAPRTLHAATAAPTVDGTTPGGARYRYRVHFPRATGRAPVPDGFSIGTDADFAAIYFEVSASGTVATREASVRQSYYLVGPANE